MGQNKQINTKKRLLFHMASYARVNSENIVTYVTHIPDDLIVNETGDDIDESKGVEILYDSIPDSINDRWILTCPEGSFKRQYASPYDIWHEDLQIFTGPKPFESWLLVPDSELEENDYCSWKPPIPAPQETPPNGYYHWDDELYKSDNSKGWVEKEIPESENTL